MNGKIAWFGGALVVCVAAGAWLLRSSETDPQQGAAPLAERGDRSALAHPEPLPAPPVQDQAKREKAEEPRTGNGAGASASAKPAPADSRRSDREIEFIAKLFEPPGADATDQERQLWEESPISDLLYPPGHPCAGQPLDSTSLEALSDPRNLPLLEIPNIDLPQCLYQGNWPFHPLNQYCSGVNRESCESVETCTNYLLTATQDPKAYPATLWLPCCRPGHPDETTLRAYFEALLAQQAAEVFSRPRCEM